MRTVTILIVADRHAEPHGRRFADARTYTSAEDSAAAAIAEALEHLGLAHTGTKLSVTVDWPHD